MLNQLEPTFYSINGYDVAEYPTRRIHADYSQAGILSITRLVRVESFDELHADTTYSPQVLDYVNRYGHSLVHA